MIGQNLNPASRSLQRRADILARRRCNEIPAEVRQAAEDFEDFLTSITDPEGVERTKQIARETLQRFRTEREQSMAERDRKALATTRLRGETLELDGYTFEPTDRPCIYHVTTPDKIIRSTGETYQDVYIADTFAATCTCAAFAHLGECKHLIGLAKAIAKAEALLAPRLNHAKSAERELTASRTAQFLSLPADERRRQAIADFS